MSRRAQRLRARRIRRAEGKARIRGRTNTAVRETRAEVRWKDSMARLMLAGREDVLEGHGLTRIGPPIR